MVFKIYDHLHKRITAVRNDAHRSLVHNKRLLRMSVVRNVDIHTYAKFDENKRGVFAVKLNF